MAGIRLTGVSKHYGSLTAVDRVDLDVRDGELMVILGPSGSGKTTLLRLVAGLDHASTGAVAIGSRDVTNLAPGARGISMVFQNYALFPHMDVATNIGFGLVARHVRPPEVRERVRRAAEMVGCGDLLDRYPDALSGGERQRVALARAVTREPDAFLLDEPLSNLDAQLRVEMRRELRALQRGLGATMLYVTHDQHEGLLLADRVAIVRGGLIQQIGSPDDVYLRPFNRFVATFVGNPSMNLFPATVSEGALVAGPFRFPLSNMVPDLTGRRLELGVRPEHLRLVSNDDSGQDAATGPVQVQLVESAAGETYVRAFAEDRQVVIRTTENVRAAAGSVLLARARLDSCTLFDADTGLALPVDA